MKPVRLGILGAGNMGAAHARTLLAGRVPGLELVALANRGADRLAPFPQVRHHPDLRSMIAAGGLDAVLIATPHPDHVVSALTALRAGLHVLLEKPVGIHKAEVARLNREAAKRPRQVFAAMFNQRAEPRFQKIRAMIQGGELGPIRRINWIVTNWFRTEAYYASGSWRATWAGEGGGLLLNQCPHNLDLLQWIFGQPKRVWARAGFGRYHDIEVEDDVTSYWEFPNGATGVFISSTGEAPGTNRLEITGDRGRLVLENEKLTLLRNAEPMQAFSRRAAEPFARPAVETIDIPFGPAVDGHAVVLENFLHVIRHRRTPLLAPGAEGIHSIELANAMLLSAWTGETVSLPLNAARYARALAAKCAASRPRKKAVAPRTTADLGASYSR